MINARTTGVEYFVETRDMMIKESPTRGIDDDLLWYRIDTVDDADEGFRTIRGYLLKNPNSSGEPEIFRVTRTIRQVVEFELNGDDELIEEFDEDEC